MFNLETIAGSHKVFVDTCTWMHEASVNGFNDRLKEALRSRGSRLIVPASVIKELNYLQDRTDPDPQMRARRAAKLVQSWIKLGLIDVFGEATDPFADHLFLNIFTRFRTKHRLALVTQDKGLARDISHLNDQHSVQSRHLILVLRLLNNGHFAQWRFGGPQRLFNAERKAVEPFRENCAFVPDRGGVLPVSAVPGEKSMVSSTKLGPLQLKERIAGGGEGVVYATDRADLVCKIYSRERLTITRRDKLQIMVSRQVRIPGVCWPMDLVSNGQGEFAGYVMQRAQGLPMQRCLFVKPLLLQHFKDWRRRELVELARTILRKIERLHAINVLIGDINPNNILVKNSREAFFVDTDSFQVEGYPCPVGTANYTAREIQSRNFGTFLRTINHENFAIATLVFMILHPGKPPYSHQGGGDPTQNIREGNFAYPLGERSTGKAPEGPWRYIWSNLPYRTKEAFYNCLALNQRLTVRDWIEIINHYLITLEHGNVTDEIFPTSLKKVSEHAQEKFGAVAKNYVHFACQRCHREFDLPDSKAERMAQAPEVLCFQCFDDQRHREGEERQQAFKREQETGVTLTCSDCHGTYLFTIAEEKYYKTKGLTRPKRCPDCRQKRKTGTATHGHQQPSEPIVPRRLPIPPRGEPEGVLESIWNFFFK